MRLSHPKKTKIPRQLKECSICLEKINGGKKAKFGLLSECSHVFCYLCITKWRKTYRRDLSKRCPVCRRPSDIVVPSKQYLIGDKKTKRIQKFQENLNRNRYENTGNTNSPICFGLRTPFYLLFSLISFLIFLDLKVPRGRLLQIYSFKTMYT